MSSSVRLAGCQFHPCVSRLPHPVLPCPFSSPSRTRYQFAHVEYLGTGEHALRVPSVPEHQGHLFLSQSSFCVRRRTSAVQPFCSVNFSTQSFALVKWVLYPVQQPPGDLALLVTCTDDDVQVVDR